MPADLGSRGAPVNPECWQGPAPDLLQLPKFSAHPRIRPHKYSNNKPAHRHHQSAYLEFVDRLSDEGLCLLKPVCRDWRKS